MRASSSSIRGSPSSAMCGGSRLWMRSAATSAPSASAITCFASRVAAFAVTRRESAALISSRAPAAGPNARADALRLVFSTANFSSSSSTRWNSAKRSENSASSSFSAWVPPLSRSSANSRRSRSTSAVLARAWSANACDSGSVIASTALFSASEAAARPSCIRPTRSVRCALKTSWASGLGCPPKSTTSRMNSNKIAAPAAIQRMSRAPGLSFMLRA